MPLPTAYEITDGLRTAFDNRSNSSYPNVEKDSLILAAVILAQQYVGVSLSCVVGKEADDTTFGLDELPENVKLAIVEIAAQLDYGRGDLTGNTPAVNGMAAALLEVHRPIDFFPDEVAETEIDPDATGE